MSIKVAQLMSKILYTLVTYPRRHMRDGGNAPVILLKMKCTQKIENDKFCADLFC